MMDPWCWYINANTKGVYWWDPCCHIYHTWILWVIYGMSSFPLTNYELFHIFQRRIGIPPTRKSMWNGKNKKHFFIKFSEFSSHVTPVGPWSKRLNTSRGFVVWSTHKKPTVLDPPKTGGDRLRNDGRCEKFEGFLGGNGWGMGTGWCPKMRWLCWFTNPRKILVGYIYRKP